MQKLRRVIVAVLGAAALAAVPAARADYPLVTDPAGDVSLGYGHPCAPVDAVECPTGNPLPAPGVDIVGADLATDGPVLTWSLDVVDLADGPDRSGYDSYGMDSSFAGGHIGVWATRVPQQEPTKGLVSMYRYDDGSWMATSVDVDFDTSANRITWHVPVRLLDTVAARHGTALLDTAATADRTLSLSPVGSATYATDFAYTDEDYTIGER